MSTALTASAKQIRISVRNLVEFLLRSGDLDNRRGGISENAMAEGGRIHRMIQRRMGSEYHPEVSLKFCEKTEEYELLIEGRADGIIILPDQITIDEIKGTNRDLERITEPESLHLAQAKCYACMYTRLLSEATGKEKRNAKLPQTLDNLSKSDTIRIRMTYCNIDTEEIKYFFEEYNTEELNTWFDDLVSQYKKWVDYQVSWEKTRNQSIK